MSHEIQYSFWFSNLRGREWQQRMQTVDFAQSFPFPCIWPWSDARLFPDLTAAFNVPPAWPDAGDSQLGGRTLTNLIADYVENLILDSWHYGIVDTQVYQDGKLNSSESALGIEDDVLLRRWKYHAAVLWLDESTLLRSNTNTMKWPPADQQFSHRSINSTSIYLSRSFHANHLLCKIGSRCAGRPIHGQHFLLLPLFRLETINVAAEVAGQLPLCCLSFLHPSTWAIFWTAFHIQMSRHSGHPSLWPEKMHSWLGRQANFKRLHQEHWSIA